tara:strand:+ start:132 stop:392 length:261 start_codon:yes stop_codon:yes gene_type:complete
MFENNIKIGDLVKIKIGDLVKSNYHVGLGIILDVITPGDDAPMIDYRFDREPMIMVYWFFPDPIEGDGWENGIDYEYVARVHLVDK